ncbi:MAG: arginine--tRNA ligase [Acidobacteriota bacterium]
MILPIHAAVRSAIQHQLTERFGIAAADQPGIVIETPPRRALGDLAVPVAFELARRLRKAPRAIAQELAASLGAIDDIARVEAAPNGYLNFFISRGAFLTRQLESDPRAGPSGHGKVIVEHTAINPNKAAHIGHLRNSTLGDTLVRLLKFQRFPVEVQNYIDDTGVQVADVVVGFTALEGRDLASIQALVADPAIRFDYYCWDLYARVTEWYAADKARLDVRRRALHDIETGGNELAAIGAFVADRIVRCHLATMSRLNVDYDLLTWEGDILRLQFWATAFEQLKERKAVYLQTEGRLAGCWVMPIDEASDGAATEPSTNAVPAGPGAADDGDAEAERGEKVADADQREKVIVRSNGTVTYVGKDIANQFWKFGLLGRDFHYRVFEPRDGQPLWATTSGAGATHGVPPFGNATAVYNVIDSRQSYLQQLLKQSLNTIGFAEQAAHSTHLSYEMVVLSHPTARMLGYVAEEDNGKPFVEVSGRKGLGVKADDLLDRLIETAAAEVASRNPEMEGVDRRRTAEAVAIAALRYFLVKFTRNKILVFDIDEALSFEGETGPYLQYAVVRAGNILAKVLERDATSETDVVAQLGGLSHGAIDEGDAADEMWGLALEAARLDEAVDTAIRALEPSVLAKYAFGLAQAFNGFYHSQPILREEHGDRRMWRLAVVAYVRRQLTRALDLMGCDVPGRM